MRLATFLVLVVILVIIATTPAICEAVQCGPGSDGFPCDDGNQCTTNDTCFAQVCEGGAPLDCNDSNVCTDDSCNPASGCFYTCSATSSNDPCCSDQVCSDMTICSFPWVMFLPTIIEKE